MNLLDLFRTLIHNNSSCKIFKFSFADLLNPSNLLIQSLLIIQKYIHNSVTPLNAYLFLIRVSVRLVTISYDISPSFHV